ncbi:bZIP 2 domain containing protein [Asbolus verrucosus]|uniref:BZIP 2 domain containing protein n=1 Tax=Asbolus verrucosus TaxID=1661398 RepID=A0A482VRA5_ASBVE|nr:bZIP 2 domain containing protein [Asbolus verrucosus]
MEISNSCEPPPDQEVLDLCIRKRPPSPDYYSPAKRPTVYVDSATCQYSPVSNSDSENSEISTKTKVCRPFKAYIKDPLTLAQGLVSSEMLLKKDPSEAFTEFRNKIMSQVRSTDNGTNKNMRRISHGVQNKNEDPTYWEKRRKNNEAAKRSRDARRAKEDEIAIRCAFLERENCHLRYLTDTLKKELEKLQKIVYLRGYQM